MFVFEIHTHTNNVKMDKEIIINSTINNGKKWSLKKTKICVMWFTKTTKKKMFFFQIKTIKLINYGNFGSFFMVINDVKHDDDDNYHFGYYCAVVVGASHDSMMMMMKRYLYQSLTSSSLLLLMTMIMVVDCLNRWR